MSDSNSNAAASSQAASTSKRLGVMGLAAIVVSSMIGGGIYSLPQNMAAPAAVGAVIIAWIITGTGMYFIANTFRTLAAARPDLTAGIYMYSKEGFGNYIGFTIAWGYWLCQICGNVGYAVITMDALNYFFPGWFAGGNNWESIIGGSILIWMFNFIVLAGVKQAAAINLVATICKLSFGDFPADSLLYLTGTNYFDIGVTRRKRRRISEDRHASQGTMLERYGRIGIEGAVSLGRPLANESAKQQYSDTERTLDFVLL